MGEHIARIVNLFQRIACQIKVLFGTNDVHFTTVLGGLADHGHVLQAEQRDLFLFNLFGAAQSVLDLPIESTLTED